MEIVIDMFWDDEAKVWCATNDDICIALESESYDKLVERVLLAVPEMAELNNIKMSGLCFKSERRMPVPA